MTYTAGFKTITVKVTNPERTFYTKTTVPVDPAGLIAAIIALPKDAA